MGEETRLKGLGDVRTALGAHIRAAPAQKGTTYRDLFLLGAEKQRLEQELARLERQQKRVTQRIGETLKSMSKLQEEADLKRTPPAAPVGTQAAAIPPAPSQSQRRWKVVPFGY